jgi:hypothetical protein
MVNLMRDILFLGATLVGLGNLSHADVGTVRMRVVGPYGGTVPAAVKKFTGGMNGPADLRNRFDRAMTATGIPYGSYYFTIEIPEGHFELTGHGAVAGPSVVFSIPLPEGACPGGCADFNPTRDIRSSGRATPWPSKGGLADCLVRLRNAFSGSWKKQGVIERDGTFAIPSPDPGTSILITACGQQVLDVRGPSTIQLHSSPPHVVVTLR